MVACDGRCPAWTFHRCLLVTGGALLRDKTLEKFEIEFRSRRLVSFARRVLGRFLFILWSSWLMRFVHQPERSENDIKAIENRPSTRRENELLPSKIAVFRFLGVENSSL